MQFRLADQHGSTERALERGELQRVLLLVAQHELHNGAAKAALPIIQQDCLVRTYIQSVSSTKQSSGEVFPLLIN